MRLPISWHPRVSSSFAASAGAFAVVAFLLLPRPSSSQDLQGEIRVRGGTSVYRVSSDMPDPGFWGYDGSPYVERSFYANIGGGVRLYPNGAHGLFVEADRRIDIDADSAMDEEPGWPVDFVLVRSGYAYRRVTPGPRRPERRARALTLSAGLVMGYAEEDSLVTGTLERSPVLGPTLALDYDMHWGRFFMGWTLSTDLVLHTRGAMRASFFLGGQILPFLRMGVTFGPRIQRVLPARHDDGPGTPSASARSSGPPDGEVRHDP